MSTNLPQLPDDQFIQDDKPKPNLPFWLWGFFLSLFTIIAGLISAELSNKLETEVEDNPFLRVTNREFSTFLWQFPEHMRVNTNKPKAGYLTGFQYKEKLNIEKGQAEDIVVAPPEILFLYHTWKRLLSDEFIANDIEVSEFIKFLRYVEEWQPQNWQAAPKEYVNLVNQIDKGYNNQESLSSNSLPIEVAQAFQGWKNFFINGDEINKIEPTYEEIQDFLKTSPHYARNYWINIVKDQYPDYLKKYSSGGFSAEDKIPQNQLTPFLKVAFYNFIQRKSITHHF